MYFNKIFDLVQQVDVDVSDLINYINYYIEGS